MASQKCTPSSSVTAGTSCTNHRPKQPPISYVLYLHREQLRKRKASFMNISYTKYHLTNELITKTVKNIDNCSADDLQILSRQTIFKKNLKMQIARMKHFQHMQMLKYQQQRQQNKKFQIQQRSQQHHQQNQQHKGNQQHHQHQQHKWHQQHHQHRNN